MQIAGPLRCIAERSQHQHALNAPERPLTTGSLTPLGLISVPLLPDR
jgi:hypothetical protein